MLAMFWVVVLMIVVTLGILIKDRTMSLVAGLGGTAMIVGASFAYLQRNSHEGVGVYGIVLGVLGLLVFLTQSRRQRTARDE